MRQIAIVIFLIICLPARAEYSSADNTKLANDLFYCGVISEFYGTVIGDGQASSEWLASKASFFRLAYLLSAQTESLVTHAVTDRFAAFVKRIEREELDDRAIKKELSSQYIECAKLVDSLHGELRERVFQSERTIQELAQTAR